jgi:hypothetical protein
MRFSSSLPLLALFLAACGGATNEPSGPAGTGNDSPASTSTSTAPTQTPGTNDSQSTNALKNECASPAAVIAKSSTTIRQPVGSVQRFQLVYQGAEIGVTSLRGVDMIIAGSDGPFAAGKNSGYWAEVRDASGKTTFTRLFRDPTNAEAPPPPGGGNFTNATIDKCIAKTILVDVPRSPSGSVLVIFGSPYGTQGTAGELARFTLE